ncbi:MAG: hypothetical protein HYY67_05030, partial [Thaumarchaeota archaeon]|nr:hypothetical protein [Nitrososphaerota archaeon]
AKAYGASVNAFVEQTRERFLIVNIAYDYPSSGRVTIWFYNYGSIGTEITTIYGGTSPSSLTSISSGSLPLPVSQGALGSIDVAIPGACTAGSTCYFKALGAKGNTQLYFQLR